jgi:hypothetical protein
MEKCMDVARRFDPTVLSDMMENGLEDNLFDHPMILEDDVNSNNNNHRKVN